MATNLHQYIDNANQVANIEGRNLSQPNRIIYPLYLNFSKEILKLSFGLSPLFLVTVSSWSSAILIIGAFLSVMFLLLTKNKLTGDLVSNPFLMAIVVGMLITPISSILFSSFLRNEYDWAEYDSASRFLIAIAIFLFAIRERINIIKYLQYTIPGGLVITLSHQLFLPQPKLWGIDRMSTYFSDPLVFGYTSLTFGIISLMSINIISKDKKIIIAFKIAGCAIGLYLSMMSGSRTGWLAIPIVIGIWLSQTTAYGDKTQIVKLLIFSAITALISSIFLYSSISSQRINLALQELLNYSWTGIAPETSIGLRITFLRIAFDMFSAHPIIGYGDTAKELYSLPEHIFTYASPESLRMAFKAGFHNEIVTNAIRYGIAGLVAASTLFIVPFIVFLRQIKIGNEIQRANAFIGIIFVICFFISSLSTEVFDLKYMASFYALVIALLCASAIAKIESQYDSHF